MLDRMEDEAGQPQYWEAFCIPLPQLTIAASETADPPQVDLTPFLQPNVEVRKGEFTVHWVAPAEVDRSNARIVPAVGPEQLEIDGGDRSFTQSGVQGGVTYQFSLQGRPVGIFGLACSDWVSIPITIPRTWGLSPGARGSSFIASRSSIRSRRSPRWRGDRITSPSSRLASTAQSGRPSGRQSTRLGAQDIAHRGTPARNASFPAAVSRTPPMIGPGVLIVAGWLRRIESAGG